jgi:hypothetical protein
MTPKSITNKKTSSVKSRLAPLKFVGGSRLMKEIQKTTFFRIVISCSYYLIIILLFKKYKFLLFQNKLKYLLGYPIACTRPNYLILLIGNLKMINEFLMEDLEPHVFHLPTRSRYYPRVSVSMRSRLYSSILLQSVILRQFQMNQNSECNQETPVDEEDLRDA